MNKKNGVIFDLDGTLIDSETIFEKIAMKVFAEFGIELTANTYSAWKGMPVQKIELAILHEFGTDFPITTFKNRFQSEWQEHLDHNGIDTMPGIKALLEQLAWEKVKISVATSTTRDKALQSLKLADLNIPQGRVIGGDMVENGKPFPDIFVKAANSMKCNPHQCIVVEDSLIGVEGAKRAKMTTIFMSYPKNEHTEKIWDYLARSPEERDKILKQLLNI